MIHANTINSTNNTMGNANISDTYVNTITTTYNFHLTGGCIYDDETNKKEKFWTFNNRSSFDANAHARTDHWL